MTMEDQADTEAGLTEARQGGTIEVTRANIPITDPLIIKSTMIVDLDQKIEQMTGNQNNPDGNLIR